MLFLFIIDKMTDYDIAKLSKKLIEDKPFVQPCIDSYDHMLDQLPTIIETQFNIEKAINNNINAAIKFIGKPPANIDDEIIQTPAYCIAENKTYRFNFKADCEIELKNREGENIHTFYFNNMIDANIPLMVGSKLCYTQKMTDEELILSNHDINDIYGYFIIDGQKKIMYKSDTRPINFPYIWKNDFKSELIRLEIQSQTDLDYGFSYETLVILRQYEQKGSVKYKYYDINIGLNLNNEYYVNADAYIPFRPLLAVMGIPTDLELIKLIFPELGINNKYCSKKLNNKVNFIIDCMTVANSKEIHSDKMTTHGDYFKLKTKEELLLKIGKTLFNGTLFYDNNDFNNNENLLIQETEKYIIKYCLPHLPKLEDKVKYIAQLIRMIVDRYFDDIDDTPRDDLYAKRIHMEGDIYTLQFKSSLSNHILNPLFSDLTDKINSISETATLVKIPANILDTIKRKISLIENSAANYSFKFKEEMIHVFKVDETKTANIAFKKAQRVKTITRSERNQNYIRMKTFSMSNRATSAETAGRSFPRVAVRPDHLFFICPIKSGESKDTIGKNKAFTPLTFISRTYYPDNIIKYINEEKKIKESIGYSKIIINGNITTNFDYDDINDVAEILRNERRKNWTYDVSIYVNHGTKNIEIYTDKGRFLSPFLIVKDNKIKIPSVIHDNKIYKNMTLYNKLFRDGYIDIMDQYETINMVIAHNLKYIEKNNNRVFSHCAIYPGIFTIDVSHFPFINHQAPTRSSLGTNHMDSTIGRIYQNPNGKFGMEHKELHYGSRPLVGTQGYAITNSKPYTINVRAAFIANTTNQEDAYEINKNLILSGLGVSSDYLTFQGEIDKSNGEENIIPKYKDIIYPVGEINNYSKLATNSAMIESVGQYIETDDILVGKFTKHDNYYKDYSIKFKDKIKNSKNDAERAINGYAVVSYNNSDINNTLKYNIEVRRVHPLSQADKIHTRFGQKGIIGSILPNEQMIYDEIGPMDIVMNTHSFISRLTHTQSMEIVAGKIGSILGSLIDGTPFINSKTIESYRNILAGLKYNNDLVKDINDLNLYSKNNLLPIIKKYKIDTKYLDKIITYLYDIDIINEKNIENMINDLGIKNITNITELVDSINNLLIISVDNVKPLLDRYKIKYDNIENFIENYNNFISCVKTVYNPQTGLPIRNKICVSTISIVIEKHKVMDKAQVRGEHGPITYTTRMPVRGKRIEGGLGFSILGRNTFVATGATTTLNSFMSDQSNPYQFYICRNCSNTCYISRNAKYPYSEIDVICPECSSHGTQKIEISTSNYTFLAAKSKLEQMGCKIEFDT